MQHQQCQSWLSVRPHADSCFNKSVLFLGSETTLISAELGLAGKTELRSGVCIPVTCAMVPPKQCTLGAAAAKYHTTLYMGVGAACCQQLNEADDLTKRTAKRDAPLKTVTTWRPTLP